MIVVLPIADRSAICLVTPDFVGPTRNGGIGSAFYHQAMLLAQAGYKVHVLYALRDWVDDAEHTIAHWKEHYAERGITLHTLPELNDYMKALCTTETVCRALDVVKALHTLHREHHFSIVHFPDWLGLGYFVVKVAQEQTCFHQVTFCIQAHSPTLWHRGHNEESIQSLEHLHVQYMEREAVALAEYIISPSKYMLSWYRKEGWELPEKQVVMQNPLTGIKAVEAGNKLEAEKINEIVFFGRLELRKGLGIFCDALARIPKHVLKGKTITFLGKESLVLDEPSLEYLQRRFAALDLKFQHEGNRSTLEAQEYLKQPGKLAVVASLLENSPYVVLEILAQGIPAIIADSGGTRELIALRDQPALFHPTEKSLADKLEQVLRQGVAPAQPAVPMNDTRAQWLQFHEEHGQEIRYTKEPEPDWKALYLHSPLVTEKGKLPTALFAQNAEGAFLPRQMTTQELSERYPELFYLFPYAEGLSDHLELLKTQLAQFSVFETEPMPQQAYWAIKRIKGHFDYLQSSYDFHRNEYDRMSAEHLKMQRIYEARENTVRHQQETLDALYASTSWKITRPLRGLMRLFKH